MTRFFSNPVILHTYPPMKMEQTECSETSAYKIQTPGNCPEESIQHVVITYAGSKSDLLSKVCTFFQNNAAKEIRVLEQSLYIISKDNVMKNKWLHQISLPWVFKFRLPLHMFTSVLLNMSVSC